MRQRKQPCDHSARKASACNSPAAPPQEPAPGGAGQLALATQAKPLQVPADAQNQTPGPILSAQKLFSHQIVRSLGNLFLHLNMEEATSGALTG